jgi:2-phospho-L-lactate guanylyltransferase
MFDHVIDTLRRSSGIAAIEVLTSDPTLVPTRCGHIPDDAGNLNAAAHNAALILRRRRVDRMLVLPADLPLVTPEDIESLLDERQYGQVVLAPNLDKSGTNALLLAPPAALKPCYGANSYERHLRAARAAGLAVNTVDRPGLAQGIDTPVDLRVLTQTARSRFSFETEGLRIVP